MKYSGDALLHRKVIAASSDASFAEPAAGAELSGDPAATFAVEALGTADFLRAHQSSATGERAATQVGQVSWAVYEWARTPYVLLVTIYLFSPYFARFVVGDPVWGLALWGRIAAIGGLIVAALAPFLGAIADKGGRRKPWIALYTVLMAAAMFAMWFVKPHASTGGLVFAGAMVAIANVSFEFSAVFHNAMLPSIAQPRRVAILSGLGLSLGNAAGILLMLFLFICFALPGHVHWPFVPAHPLWGINQAMHEPERLSGPLEAVWLLVFCLPLFLFTPDRKGEHLPIGTAIAHSVRAVWSTIRSLRRYQNVGAYLFARLFFNDGMTAVLTFGGIYAATTFNWGPIELLLYGVELSIFAVLGGFVGGWLDNHLGSKRAIFVSIGGTTIVGLATLSMAPDRILWFIPYDVHAPAIWSLPFFRSWPEIIYLLLVNFIAVLITAGYANSRTMLARIAPPEKMTEFFGLYQLSGSSTTFLATGFVSWLAATSHSQRIGLLGETMFLTIGLLLMLLVKEERDA
ncbi:MAG TPA: MFS transporter [Rhizomicrobium sp.]|nr:MFS transporter [Rhizomicrobium sp.]